MFFYSIKHKGFTLLELLIAMAVFAIMSVMAYSGLKILLDARAQTSIKSAQLSELQMALYLLNEDLLHSVTRSVRDDYGTDEMAMHGGMDGEILTLTRSVPAWSGYQSGSQLQRISYRLEQGALYRYVWTTLDRTQQSESRRRKLLALENLQLRFFKDNWTTFWSANETPKAMEMTFTVQGLGEIKRLFFIHS
ncbi:type II secretion system minor pseudopilin GspJ [Methylovulum miyakonense]|uniref:type II secretion system minor pseudopilin GspJ n=1 Tax=Methylovulum miyakonense TaxID=645578 RepID=UPI000365E857|nr:type II secretion system minor pseudopilin GspJ [Methylovulum miyakonense]